MVEGVAPAGIAGGHLPAAQQGSNDAAIAGQRNRVFFRRGEPAGDEGVDLAIAGTDLHNIETALHVDEAGEGLLGKIGQVSSRLEPVLEHSHFVGDIDQEQAARLQ